MRYLFFTVIVRRIKAIRFMMKDKTVPKRKKLIIIFGLVYLVLPVDLIPPFVPVFGMLDDLILWLFILNHLREELDKYWTGEDKKHDFTRDHKGKNVIEVDFEVKEVKKEEADKGEDYDR